jgi:hypothetical protein
VRVIVEASKIPYIVELVLWVPEHQRETSGECEYIGWSVAEVRAMVSSTWHCNAVLRYVNLNAVLKLDNVAINCA